MQLRQIALNPTGGALVDIAGASWTRYVELMEDEAQTPTGIALKFFIDNFATLNTYSFGSEPVMIPSVQRSTVGGGQIIGFPAQGSVGAFNYIAARVYAKAVSAGSATVLRVVEDD